MGFPRIVVKGGRESTCSAIDATDTGSSPGSGGSRGGGNGNPSQYSCLGNPVDRGALWAIVHGMAELDMT